MRLGCSGCLTSLLLVLAIVAGLGVTLWGAVGVFQAPSVKPVVATRADWIAAQTKIRSLDRRMRGRVVFSDRELTAMASRRLAESTPLPIIGVSVRVLAGGVVEVAGLVPIRLVLAETSLAQPADWLPAAWLARPLWMRLRARPRLEEAGADRRYLRLDVEEFGLGRRALPRFLPRLLLSPDILGLFSIPMPDVVEGVSAESGRLVIKTGA